MQPDKLKCTKAVTRALILGFSLAMLASGPATLVAGPPPAPAPPSEPPCFNEAEGNICPKGTMANSTNLMGDTSISSQDKLEQLDLLQDIKLWLIDLFGFESE